MSLSYQNILQVRITSSPRETILEEIRKYLNLREEPKRFGTKTGKKPLVITTPNPEQIVFAQTHQAFRDILNRADVALPDGVGIVLASRFLQKSTGGKTQMGVHERIPGVEFMENLVRMAGDQGIRIGLIGGAPGLAVDAFECLRDKYPRLQGWALVPEDVGMEEIAQKIRSTRTQIVFVGLGAPKQEYFIERIKGYVLRIKGQKTRSSMIHDFVTSPLVFMSVGGSFDIITGRLKRAPVFMRSIGFEWAWRLANEPWRMQRQMALITFVWLVMQEKFFSRSRQRD